MCLIYLVASLRTDVVHVIIFFTLVVAYGLIAGEEWSTASGHSETAHNLQLASGVFLLICDLAVWYLFIIEILASVDFPFTLPVVSLPIDHRCMGQADSGTRVTFRSELSRHRKSP